MFRYVAYVWNDEDPPARAQARSLLRRSPPGAHWRTLWQGRGIEVRCVGARGGSCEPYWLAGGAGVVLGTLFARGTDGSIPAPTAFGESDSRSLLAGGGRRLMEAYWGRYVAFLHEPGTCSSWVLRDPSGGLPCYTLRLGAVDVYFSWLEDVLPLCETPLTIDWSFLLAGLSRMREHCARTGLREVTQVMAGECVEIRPDAVTRRFYWDPLAIAAEAIEDARQACEAMSRCVRDVVQAWAGCYRGVLLSLSGGLDSSIILASLARGEAPRLHCYHYYPREADLDERRFARAAASAAGLTLMERPRPWGFSLEPLLSIHAAPEPTNYPYYLEHSRAEAELAAECGAEAVFIGYGGDQLFYQEGAQWAAGDFLRRRGLRPGWARVLLDSARMDQVSVWRVLRAALAASAGRFRWSLAQEAGRGRPLLSRAAVMEAARAADCLHPLLHGRRGTPSGKLWHAHQILAPFDYYDPLGEPRDPQRIAPLLSQPLMELCLRIPTYVLTEGGWDRAVARRAFYGALPPEIRNRRDKGGMEAQLRFTVERNRRLLNDLLADGSLVREGLIDRAQLAKVLSGRAQIETESSELLEYAGVEAWLRTVSSQRASLWQTRA